MASALIPPTRNPLFQTPAQKRLSPPVVMGIAVATLVHLGLAAYIIHERFEVKLAETPDGTKVMEAPMVIIEPKPAPVVEKPRPQSPPIRLNTPDHISQPVENPLPMVETPTSLPETVGPVTSYSAQPGPVVESGPVQATGPTYVKAVWSRFPDSATLLEYYPARAMDAEVEGAATLACTVRDTKGRVKCEVLSESPRGYGFGDAAVRAVEAKGRADTSNGAVEVGATMRVKMGFALQ